MANRLYMDVHLPRPVTDGLRVRGIDVLTAQEDGADELDDEDLLLRAKGLGRVLVSQDTDLLAIGAKWQQAGHPFPGIAFAHQLGPGIGELIDELELLADCMEEHELENRVIFLPQE